MSSFLSMRGFRDLVRDESGATAIEYALIASGVAGAIIAAVMALGSSLQGMYQSVSTSLN
jgi:pilus assembly protein Flp/PilA